MCKFSIFLKRNSNYTAIPVIALHSCDHQQIYAFVIKPAILRLSLSQLSAGIYLLKINNKDTKTTLMDILHSLF